MTSTPPHLSTPVLGCIADDITGATDLASALTAAGLRTSLLFGVPAPDDTVDPRAHAVIIALKSRALPTLRAIEATAESCRWLRALGVPQLYLKYCSTFDSTSEGNIGPTADALLDQLGVEQVVHSPAYPANGRTIYLGHLFVGSSLLSESGMQEHPLTPMTDALLTRVLAAQTDQSVGLLPLTTIRDGPSAIVRHLDGLAGQGIRHVICDAVEDEDLRIVANAVRDRPVLAGAAAFAGALAHGLVGTVEHQHPDPDNVPGGPTVFLVGSASATSSSQVAQFAGRGPIHRLDTARLDDPDGQAHDVVDWVLARLGDGSVLVSSDTSRAGLAGSAARYGHAEASMLVEQTLSLIAAGLLSNGVRTFVVAGGETSGAVAEALSLRTVRIGADIATGVPWTFSEHPSVAVAFKSGGFGGPAFFTDVLEQQERRTTTSRRDR